MEGPIERQQPQGKLYKEEMVRRSLVRNRRGDAELPFSAIVRYEAITGMMVGDDGINPVEKDGAGWSKIEQVKGKGNHLDC
jgi:hypothetical protein